MTAMQIPFQDLARERIVAGLMFATAAMLAGAPKRKAEGAPAPGMGY